jgi:hypothetical protein
VHGLRHPRDERGRRGTEHGQGALTRARPPARPAGPRRPLDSKVET